MDLKLPELNGLDVTIAICGEDRGARIIALTIRELQNVIERAMILCDWDPFFCGTGVVAAGSTASSRSATVSI
jgi:hypothetical protein